MKSDHSNESGREIGTPIAVLSLEPDEFVARGIVPKFERDYDDLDYVEVAWLRDNVALVRHPRSPAPGTEVVISDFRPEHRARASRELAKVLRSLQLSKRDVAWIRPDVDHPGLANRMVDLLHEILRIVMLDPDVFADFPNSAAVNKALRAILDAAPARRSKRRHP